MAWGRGVARCIFLLVFLCVEMFGHVELPARVEQAVSSLRNGRQLPPYRAREFPVGPAAAGTLSPAPSSLDSRRLPWDTHATCCGLPPHPAPLPLVTL